MRIGIICHSSCGGSSRVAIELSLHLARRGHQIHLFSLLRPFGLDQQETRVTPHYFFPEDQTGLHPSVLYTEWSQAEQERFLAGLIEVIGSEGLDVLHFHYALPFAFLLAELKHRLGPACPFLVGTLHGTDVSVFGRDPGWAGPLKLALAQIDLLTTVSQNHAMLAAELLQLVISPRSFRVIPNFLDLNLYSSFLKGSKFNPPREAGPLPRIIHISNFRPIKAPAELGLIFAKISATIDAELWLIGEGPGLEELKKFFIREGLNGRVRYWGLQPTVGPILAQADLLLMTSQAESFCLAILEAMACGIPAVSTRVGGIPELVAHGQSGFLYPPGQQELAVEYTLKLLTDPDLNRSFAKAALQQSQNFSSDRIIGLYEEVYNQAFSGILS